MSMRILFINQSYDSEYHGQMLTTGCLRRFDLNYLNLNFIFTFRYDQQTMKPGVQHNLPAPKNEDNAVDSVGKKKEDGHKEQIKVDENNNKIDTSI